MGISAELIQFCKDGIGEIGDLNDQNLYEYFPENMHHLIFQTEVEIYDLDYYRELYNDQNLYIYSVGCDGIQLSRTSQPDNPTDKELDEWYNNLIKLSDPKIKIEICNAINYNILGNIGGKESFKNTIFKLYHTKEHYPYLWQIKDNILKDKKSWVYNHQDKPFVYIDLGY